VGKTTVLNSLEKVNLDSELLSQRINGLRPSSSVDDHTIAIGLALTFGYALRSYMSITVNWGSILRVWLPLLLGLYCLHLIFAGGPGPHDLTHWIGLVLSLVGLAGVILARYTLGRSFSVKAKATELVTTGIYSRIRNPIYVFGLIFMVGLILMVRNPVLGLVLVLIIPIQIIRARREAQVLEAKFGEAYRQYRDRT